MHIKYNINYKIIVLDNRICIFHNIIVYSEMINAYYLLIAVEEMTYVCERWTKQNNINRVYEKGIRDDFEYLRKP